MPIREYVCHSEDCGLKGRVQEHFFHRASDIPVCECGGSTEVLPSVVHGIWLRPINEYNVSGHDTLGQNSEGHIAYRTRSSRLVNGEPEACLIRSVQDQKEYCKAEGLALPSELPSVAHVNPDGTSISGRGLPGQEI